MTLDDLTVSFAHIDRDGLLADWVWLIGTSRLPILVTAAGDAFLQDVDDGSVLFLDTQAAELSTVADSPEELRSLLADRQFVYDYLFVEMCADLAAKGRTLGPGQVYDLEQPMVLGGNCVPDNIRSLDMAVHFSLLGQIHERTHNLPEGTSVAGVGIE
ncbi:MAG: DUF1851 domain-containing protein [Coriobacteriia bacterium]|nr:DUF1851 domain-containing protein [Coriobacteriia bacterium]